MKHHLGALLFCGILLLGSAAAQEIPKPDGYVNDFAGVLDQPTKDVLTAKTRQLKADKNIELGVAVITTTGGRDIAEYGTRMAREWGVGSKDGERRGLLLVVATRDRKSNIQVSRHLEGDFTDARTGEMLRTGRDDFKAGNFGAGLVKITDALIARANSVGAEDQTATPAEENQGRDVDTLYLCLAVVGFGAVGVYSVVRELLSLRKKPKGLCKSAPDDASLAAGYVAGAALDGSSAMSSSPTSHHSSSSNSHGSSSGSSSRSSSSFGGGSDFGGGGASDSW